MLMMLRVERQKSVKRKIGLMVPAWFQEVAKA